jgi:acyl dehydratase
MPAPSALKPGLELTFSFSISSDMMAAFGLISGDHHPLHINDDYAVSHGFERRVVYGGLLVAQVSRLIGAELPVKHCVWTRLQIEFREPLYIDQRAEMTASIVNVAEAVSALTLKFRIARETRLIGRGSADVLFSDD